MKTGFVSNNLQYLSNVNHCDRTIEDSLKDLETFVVSSTKNIHHSHLSSNGSNDYKITCQIDSNSPTIEWSNKYNSNNNNTNYSIPRNVPYSNGSPQQINKLNEFSIPMCNYNLLQNISSPSSNYENVCMSNKSVKSSAIIPTWINIPENSKFFIIKSNNLEQIKKSFYNSIWSSTHFGNKRLSESFQNLNTHFNHLSKLFLFFSVNGSGKFCGVAEMISDLRNDLDTSIWSNNEKFGLAFKVRWVIVRDINNKFLKKFLLPNNEMKPVTYSRDTQEIPFLIGKAILKLFKSQNWDIDEITSFLDND